MAQYECPFCTHSRTTKFEDTNFFRCRECGLFINKPMTELEVKNTNKNFLLSACHNSKTRESRINEAKNFQLKLLEEYGNVGKVYDVGAAGGFFLYAARENGWEIGGNEISIAAIKWAKSNFNIDLDYGFFEEITLSEDYYDAVVLWNTLEHTHNPKTTLEKCYSILKKEGLLFIKVPNKKTAKELKTQYETVHLFEFTDECLCKHLDSIGFKKMWLEPNDVNPKSGVVAAIYLYKKVIF